MSYEFTVSDVIPTSPRNVYDAWLNSDGHTNMTGSPAHIFSAEETTFTAWDGYITGRNITLDPAKRIVQSWRTTDFTDADPDSQIEILLEEVPGGTKIKLHHTNVPNGQFGYPRGWQERYFEPMKAFFGDRVGMRVST